ncbi:MAG: hypothetical protein H6510_03105 [Acidobacteria bacterium]|nr:hypothetical protein [Acidobacteriota bacterium]
MLVFLYDFHSGIQDEPLISDETTIGQARTVGFWTHRPDLIRVPDRHMLAESCGAMPMDLFRYELIGRLYADRWFWPPYEEYQWINGFLMCLDPQTLARLDERMGLKNGRKGALRRILIPVFHGHWQPAWSYVEKSSVQPGSFRTDMRTSA